MSFHLHACTQTASPLTNSFSGLWYACPCVNDALHQVAGVADKCLVQCTHSPASVAKLCSHLGFRVNRIVWPTQILRDKIHCFLLKELDCFASIEWRQNTSFLSQLFKNKVSKNEETRKVEWAHHFCKCADAVYQKLRKLEDTCWNYSLRKWAHFLRRSVLSCCTKRIHKTINHWIISLFDHKLMLKILLSTDAKNIIIMITYCFICVTILTLHNNTENF